MSNTILSKLAASQQGSEIVKLGNAISERIRNGETIYFTLPKEAVVRTWCLNHLYHHRAQLTVYLRLLNIPVPGMYGPTADSVGM